MSDNYFETQIRFQQEVASGQEALIQDPPPGLKLNLAYLILHNRCCKLMTASYSGGVMIDSIKPIYLNCLQALDLYKKHPKSRAIFFVKEVDEYMNALALLTWGLALKVESAVFDELVTHLDAEGQRDALIDTLIAARQPQRPISPTLYFPKLYSPLYEAATTRTPQAIGRFLSRWYNTCLKKTASHDLHLLHGGDDSGFTGYWAWEVAGLTLALDLDDSSYRQMPYYPADLVAYARQG